MFNFSYVLNKKLPGRELRSSVIKAISFMNKDVKVPLGIKVNTASTTPKVGNIDNSNKTPVGSQVGGNYLGG